MLFLYNFEVKYYDESTDRDATGKGIVAGYNYGEALATVTKYVGEENVIKIQLAQIEDSEGGLIFQDLTPDQNNQ